MLDQTLESAGDRTREIARMVAEFDHQGTRAISENFEAIRAANEDEYKRTAEAMRALYDQTTGDAHIMFDQAAERFAEVVAGAQADDRRDAARARLHP